MSLDDALEVAEPKSPLSTRATASPARQERHALRAARLPLDCAVVDANRFDDRAGGAVERSVAERVEHGRNGPVARADPGPCERAVEARVVRVVGGEGEPRPPVEFQRVVPV